MAKASRPAGCFHHFPIYTALLDRDFPLTLSPPLFPASPFDSVPVVFGTFASSFAFDDLPVVSGTFAGSGKFFPPGFASFPFSTTPSPPSSFFTFSAAAGFSSFSTSLSTPGTFVGVPGGVSMRILNEISVPFEEEAGVTYVTKARVLLRRLTRLNARFEALSSESSSSSRDLFELELRRDADDAEELLSRSRLMIWLNVVSSCLRDLSRKSWISSLDRLGRACCSCFNGAVL